MKTNLLRLTLLFISMLALGTTVNAQDVLRYNVKHCRVESLLGNPPEIYENVAVTGTLTINFRAGKYSLDFTLENYPNEPNRWWGSIEPDNSPKLYDKEPSVEEEKWYNISVEEEGEPSDTGSLIISRYYSGTMEVLFLFDNSSASFIFTVSEM